MVRQWLRYLMAVAVAAGLGGACPFPVQAADGPVTLTVHEPTGAYEVTQLHAPRLETLEGKTVCEIASYNWEWAATFAVIRVGLKREFPTVKIVPWDRMGIDSRADEENHALVARQVREKGCQAVIVGNAG